MRVGTAALGCPVERSSTAFTLSSPPVPPNTCDRAGSISRSKDVAQQDQALETILLECARRFVRMTRLCTQVQVGEDQRVVDMQIHSSVCSRGMFLTG